MNRIVIRTLGGKNIGYGHYYRCLSLAKAILNIDMETSIKFFVNNDLLKLIKETNFDYIINDNFDEDINTIESIKPDLFIFDSYLGDNKYLEGIKKLTKLMLVDDNNDIYDSSIPDIIYNGNIHANDLGYREVENQIGLLGPKYLIMKEEYWGNNDSLYKKDGVLITTGGTDNFNMSLNLVNMIKDLDINIKIVIGPGYANEYIKEIESILKENIEIIYKPSSLKEYISRSKIVITAGGSTVYEILSQMSVPILFSISDNQDILCSTLANIGVDYLGKYPNINYDKLVDIIDKLRKTENNINHRLFDLVDGEGALRTAKIILDLID